MSPEPTDASLTLEVVDLTELIFDFVNLCFKEKQNYKIIWICNAPNANSFTVKT